MTKLRSMYLRYTSAMTLPCLSRTHPTHPAIRQPVATPKPEILDAPSNLCMAVKRNKDLCHDKALKKQCS